MWKTIITIIILAAVAYGVSFFVKPQQAQIVEAPKEDPIMKTLDVKHQYKDGTHTFVGDLELPNPCYTYNSVIEDTEDPQTKKLKIILKENKQDSCVQVIANANYSVSYQGDENLKFRGFVNDEEYKLNMFEVPADIDINDLEIYMKG